MPVDATAPTVSTESVLTIEKLDAHKGQDVGIFDIPGAFISADMDKDVKMALCGILSKKMVKIASQIYRQHKIYKKRRPFLHVNLNKALYNCLRLALLLYERLVADMRGKGFEINPYDLCVDKDIPWRSSSFTRIIWVLFSWKISGKIQEQSRQSTPE